MRARRAVVAGGGVTGLAAALLLRRAGLEVELHEAADRTGGMVRPAPFRGVGCDLGSHRLHPEALAEPLLREISRAVPFESRPRRGRIVLGGRHLPYPLSPLGLLHGLGPARAASFAAGWLGRRSPLARWEQDRTLTGRDAGFDEGYDAFVRARVGDAAYEAFYRPYAEKVWGVHPTALSRTVAKKRLSTTRPAALLARGLRGGERYTYPTGGMAALLAALDRMARQAGVRVLTGRRATRDTDADAVVWTAPLGQLAPGHGLRHRGLYLLFLAFPVPRISDVETFYVPERAYWFGRVSEASNYSDSMHNRRESVLCVEIPEGAWGPGRDFTAQVPELVDQLREAGILPRTAPAPVEARQVWLPGVYPVYERGWQARWTAALREATADGRTVPTGRQGLYLHCNIDHCLETARAAADHVTARRGADAWVAQASPYAELRVRD